MKDLNTVDLEIIKWLAEGLTLKEMSAIMKHPDATLETYRYRLFKKIKVKNAPECVAWGFRNKVLN